MNRAINIALALVAFVVMVLIARVAPAATETGAAALILPSGQEVHEQEVLSERSAYGLTYRFRYIGAGIGLLLAGDDPLVVERDMAFLCETVALPRLAGLSPYPASIIISIAERAVPFGTSSPDTRQAFEAYRPEGDRCIWEGL